MDREQKFSCFEAVDADVDGLRQHYASTLKPVRISPAPRTMKISVEDKHFKIGEFDIWAGSCSSGMNVSFSEPPDAYTMYLPVMGAMEFDLASAKIHSSPGTIFVCDLDQVRNLSFSPGRSHIGIAFSKDTLKRQLSKLIGGPVMRDIEFQSTLEMSTDFGARLGCMCQLLWDHLSCSPQSALTALSSELFFQTIMVSLLENLPHSYSALVARRSSTPVPRHVKLAIEFMVAEASRPLSVDEIALAAGVSVRTLQLAFQEFRDVSPLGFLRNLRLNGAREDLRRRREVNVSIAEVAQRWGFTHMGRFASLYRAAFGESPSATRSD